MDPLVENAELALKILGGVTSATTAVVTWLKSRTRLRAKLKTDIDILEALDAGHPKRPLVEERISDSIDQIYGADSARFQHRYLAGFLGLVLVAGFIWWSVSIFKDDGIVNWWVIATGYGAMTGLYLVLWSLGVYDREAVAARAARRSPTAGQTTASSP